MNIVYSVAGESQLGQILVKATRDKYDEAKRF